MKHENTDDSFITIHSIKKNNGRKLLVNGEINFKTKYDYLKPKLPLLSQEQLIDIARTDGSWQIRRKALMHIRNSHIFFQIAFNDESFHVRQYFLKHFNQTALRKLALTDPSVEVRRDAVKLIEDEKTLKHVALTDPSLNVRKEAIKHVKDKKTLKHVALTDPSLNVRKEAIKHVKDEKTLKYIALNNSSKTVRTKAAEKIKDPKSFKELVQSDINTSAKIEIMEKINDEKFLLDLFKASSSNGMKLKIIEKLTNEEYLFEAYAEPESDASFQKEYRKKLIGKFKTNESILFKAFKLERDHELRELIFNEFESEETFEQILFYDSSNIFRCKAFEKIKNQEILLKVIYEDFDELIKLDAIANLNPENLLKIYSDLSFESDLRQNALLNLKKDSYLIEICENSNDVSEILIALSNIDNQEFITDFGVKHENWKIRSLAIAKIDDENLLADIALNENCRVSRKIALKKIKSPEILLNLFELGCVDLIDEADIKNFKDNEDILTCIALNHKYKSFRKKAVELIKNKETLKNVVLTDESLDVRTMALVKNDEGYRKSKIYGRFFKPNFRIFDEDASYEYLKKIENDKPHYIKVIVKEAINNIHNESYLKNLALCSASHHVRSCAIASDNFNAGCGFSEDELFKCILTVYEERKNERPINFKGNENRLLEKIHDESILFYFIIDHSKDNATNQTLFDALKCIGNEKLLYEIACCEHVNLSLKVMAADGINNPEMLEDIVRNHPNRFVRNQAVKNIKDENLIMELALNDPTNMIRKSAVLWSEYTERPWSRGIPEETGNVKVIISNEEMLEEILLKSNDEEIRKIALKMIKDEERLSGIAIKSQDRRIRTKATQYVKDQKILMDIALNDPSRIVRTTAINSIDEDNLIRIINDLKDWYNRDCIIKQIHDKHTIIDSAFNDSNCHVRYTAVSKIGDDNLLEQVALTEDNINVRKLAIEKITDRDILNDILRKTTHYTTPNMVKEKLRRC